MNEEFLKMDKRIMKGGIPVACILLALALWCAVSPAKADDRNGRIQVGTGLLYRNGMDLTVTYEYETNYHHAWEFFGNVYLKWEECADCKHVCPESFWNHYNTWGVGAAYKPCVFRSRNQHGNLRIGASLGSDRHRVLGGIHAGYEHNYALRKGWELFWQVKTDLMIKGEDLFRTGVVVGVKIPVK